MAVLQDAGKSKALRVKYGISNNIPHKEASYLYAKEVLKDSSYDFMADYLFKDTGFLKYLQKADKIAREKELVYLK